jgi:hypothetical protein
MDWSALAGGLIGAGIPATLAYLGLRRGRQSADAEAFGPAVLLLYDLEPHRVTMHTSRNEMGEALKWGGLQRQLDSARERLLVVSTGNPRRHVRTLAEAAEGKLATAYRASEIAAQNVLKGQDIGQPMASRRHREAC